MPFATGVGILLVGAAAVPLLRPDLPLLVPADLNPAICGNLRRVQANYDKGYHRCQNIEF